MSKFSRTDRPHRSWHRALHVALNYAIQQNHRYRVHGVRGPDGWWWMVERTPERIDPARPGNHAHRREDRRMKSAALAEMRRSVREYIFRAGSGS